MSFDPAHPGAQATDLAANVGGQVLHVAETIAPVAVPFVLALGAIRWTLSKFGLSGTASVVGYSGAVQYDEHGAKCKGCSSGRVDPGEGAYCWRCVDRHESDEYF